MTGVSQSDYIFTLELIVEAAANPEAWSKVLRQLAKLTDCVAGGITVENPYTGTGTPIVYFGFDPDHVTKTFSHYLPMNPLFKIAPKMKTGYVVANGDVMPTKDFIRTEFYDGWARPQGLCSPLTLVLDHGDTYYCPLTLVRPDGTGEASDSDRKLLSRLAPHLSRALRTHRHLEAANARLSAAEAVIDSMPVAVYLLDRAGRLIYANAAGGKLLAEGQELTCRSGGLEAFNSVTLNRAILKVLSGDLEGGSEITLNRPDRAPLLVTVMPVAGSNPFQGQVSETAHCAVLVTDPDMRRLTNVDAMARLFHLTPAETRILKIIVSGASLTTAAGQLGVSLNTARTHLKHIFYKTQTNRQSDLIQMAVNSNFQLKRHV